MYTYTLGRGPSPIHEIRVGDRVVATSRGARGLYVVDQTGRLGDAASPDETMRVEARGPLTASVRFEGFYRTRDGKQLARHITRLEFFAGQPAAYVTHTLTLTNDTNKLWLKDVGWELSAAPGASPSALFATSRKDWRQAKRFDVPAAGVFMIQDDHVEYGGGRNHFYVAKDDKAKPPAEGAECGDWAALRGANGGLMVSCRDTAVQHPKEFELTPGKFHLRLFSTRAGQEIDFRAEALIKRWNRGGRLSKGTWLAQIRKTKSNAIGWAKTHQFFLRPVAPEEKPEALARLSRLHSEPVLALADPAWLHASRALGPLYPRDPKRFPEAEEHIEQSFQPYYDRIDGIGEYGFIDYWAGPHYQGFPSGHRYRLSYTLRHDVWLLYARSGRRLYHRFATNSARTFMDTIMARWEGPKNKKGLGKYRGLFIGSGGSFCDKLPYYWEHTGYPEFSTDTQLGHILAYYRLLGYRRGKDVVEEYRDGVKKWWRRDFTQYARTWRPLMMLRCLRQAYALTWDPDLRTMVNAVIGFLYDPAITVALTKDRPYSSPLYKTHTDVSSLIRLWRQFGTPRLREMATKLSWRLWLSGLGRSTNNRFQRGVVADFLYEQTGDPRVAAGTALSIRQESGEKGPTGVSHVVARFQALPYSESLAVRTNADRKSLCSWAGFEDFGYPVSFVVSKKKLESLDMTVNLDGDFQIGNRIAVKPVRKMTRYALGGIRIDEFLGALFRVLIPKDADQGEYEITTAVRGTAFVMTNGRYPLVVYAPRYFRPSPKNQNPFTRIYFKLPKGEKEGQVFFEGSAKLFDPKGKPYGDGKPIQGWVTLPADKPGLWSFQPMVNFLVRVRNLPPFFAYRDPAYYFEPAIAWPREPIAKPERLDPKQAFVPGVGGEKGGRALFVTGQRSFVLEPGPAHPSGDGGRFLPFKQGTIEMYLKPQWSTFSLWPKSARVLVRMPVKGPAWLLQYAVNPPRERWRPMRSHFSHVFRGSFATTHPGRNRAFYGCRRAIVEQGEWIHVAWVWGQRISIGAHREKNRLVTTRIFVNGKLGLNHHYYYKDAWPKYAPQRMIIPGQLDAAVDKLRVSDVIRYTKDFDPPAPDRPLKIDPHTRAAFEFDGDLEGRSYGYDGKLPARMGE